MNWIRILALAITLGWDVQEGFGPRYGPGVMERVSRNRDMPLVGCMISSPTLPLGSWAYVYGVRSKVLRYCRITDVSQDVDRARHIRTKRIAELSFEVAKSICGHTTEPSIDCPIIVISEGE